MSDIVEDVRRPYDREMSVSPVQSRCRSSLRQSSPSTSDWVSQHPPVSNPGTNSDHLDEIAPYCAAPPPLITPQFVSPPVPNAPLPEFSSVPSINSVLNPSHASLPSPDSQLLLDPDRDPVSLAQDRDRIGPVFTPADQPVGSTVAAPLPMLAPPLDLLAWNCNGIGNAKTSKHLKELRKQRRLKVVFLCETRLKRGRIEALKDSLRFDHCIEEPAVGQSGGLAILWDKEVDLSLCSISKNYIDTIIKLSSLSKLSMIFLEFATLFKKLCESSQG